MLQSGHYYTFHVRGGSEGPYTYLGRFQTYDADDQGRPTMFTIEQQDGTTTTLLTESILSIDYGDTRGQHYESAVRARA